MSCVAAGQNDADVVLIWTEVGESFEEGFKIRVVWTEAHT